MLYLYINAYLLTKPKCLISESSKSEEVSSDIKLATPWGSQEIGWETCWCKSWTGADDGE